MIKLSDEIVKNRLELKITLDIPQLLTAHNINKHTINKMKKLFDELKEIAEYIEGIHIWGRKGRASHCGDLNTYFENDINAKSAFLDYFKNTFNDNIARSWFLR